MTCINTFHHIRSLNQHFHRYLTPKKFPTNSESIHQLSIRVLSHYSIKTIPFNSYSGNNINNTPFAFNGNQIRLISSNNKRKASTLSHNSRVTLRWLGYWSPRIVIIGWFCSVIVAGLYLLKKSIDTDGFSTTFSPGTGGDINKEDWTMINHDGQKYSKDDSMGKYLLIYFGFTFCPDVCPVEMQKLSEIADILEKRGIGLDIIQPVFVSVDYKRDTPQMIKNYIKQYTKGNDKNILGLCGTREQIEHFARVMKTYFSDPPQLEEDYILEHSTYMYFTGTDGSFKHLTNTEDGSQVLANKIALWISEDKGKFAKVSEQIKQVFT
eukprot:854783_1